MPSQSKLSRRRVTAVVISGFGSALLTGCLSPTLPLPPPSRPDISPPDSQGLSTISGRVPAGTTALAQNLASGRIVGQVTGETGFYQLRLLAESGDQVAIWYRDVFQDSGSIVVVVPDGESGGMGGAAGASGR